MKDLLYAVKKESINKFVKTLKENLYSTTGQINTWTLLKEMDGITQEPIALLKKIAPEYHNTKKEVNLQILSKAKPGQPIEIEARFYKIDRRNLELKIFARQILKKKKSIRIAKATYKIEARHQKLPS